MDTVVATCSRHPETGLQGTGGGQGGGGGGRGGRYSWSEVDLPIVWQRLQLNQMGSYTHPEHIAGAYARTWRFLTGTGIYPLTSVGFNHSCRPNLLRVSVGPLILFRTSRPVQYGEALTISYVGTDLLREPLDIRLGEDEDTGGGLGDRDFICGCSLCISERTLASCAGAEAAAQTSSKVIRVPMEIKAQLLLMDAHQRAHTLRAWLSTSETFKKCPSVAQGDEDDDAPGHEYNEEEDEPKTALGPKVFRAQGAADFRAQTAAKLATAESGALEAAASGGDVASGETGAQSLLNKDVPMFVGEFAQAAAERLLNKDALELSVELALALVQCERAEEALQVLRQLQHRALSEWLPRNTTDELQSSFALYTLVAAAALACANSPTNLHACPAPALCIPFNSVEPKETYNIEATETYYRGIQSHECHAHQVPGWGEGGRGAGVLELAAREAVREVQAVFGARAAPFLVFAGSPSALRAEVEAACEKVPRASRVAQAAWEALLEAAKTEWPHVLVPHVHLPSGAQVSTEEQRGERQGGGGGGGGRGGRGGGEVIGAGGPRFLAAQEARDASARGPSLSREGEDGFTKEWEEEMRVYGYSSPDLACMRTGEWREDRGETEDAEHAEHAEHAPAGTCRNTTRKAAGGAGGGEEEEEEEVFTAEWEAEMREYGYTQVQIDMMKHGEWEENDADDEGAHEGGEGLHEVEQQDEKEAAEVVSLGVEAWEKLSLSRFFDAYMLPNRPVVIADYVAGCPCDKEDGHNGYHDSGRNEHGSSGAGRGHGGAGVRQGDSDRTGAGKCELGWRAWREWVTSSGTVNTKHLRDRLREHRL
jgi:hypothetical protein